MPRMRCMFWAIAALLLAGCVARTLREGPGPTRVLVVEALDRTGDGHGLPAAEALADALSAAGVPVVAIEPRPASVLSAAWLEARCRKLDANAVVTGRVSAWSLQADRNRAYVAMTALLLSPGGNIRWAERVTGTAPSRVPATNVMVAAARTPTMRQDGTGRSVASPDDALTAAAFNAAKEFATDVAPRL